MRHLIALASLPLRRIQLKFWQEARVRESKEGAVAACIVARHVAQVAQFKSKATFVKTAVTFAHIRAGDQAPPAAPWLHRSVFQMSISAQGHEP